MKFIVSNPALHSFPAEPHGCKAVDLISVSVAKVRHFYSKTDDGRIFFTYPDGVEKPSKLNAAITWIEMNNEIWAPVIDLRAIHPEAFFFADGRHTFVALERSGYKCIEIAVPRDRAHELQVLLCCDHV